MLPVCLYFQLHQPFRVKKTRPSENNSCLSLFDDTRNASFFKRAAEKCYRPAGELFLKLLKEYPSSFKIAYSFSGTWISQCQLFDPALLDLYRQIVALPNVEILCETSHHTLSSLVDPDEFIGEVRSHRERISEIFGKTPTVFRNTELIYSDNIGSLIANEGFSGCLIEGWEHMLESDFDLRHVFHHPDHFNFKLLPRHYRRSDDIAFRFSNRLWSEWPLSGEKFQSWLKISENEGASFVGIFMDYETIGEHQWKETGIFEFFDYWVRLACSQGDILFWTPSELIEKITPRGALSSPFPVSWADVERDVSAWVGNHYQREAVNHAYSLAPLVHSNGNDYTLELWKRLLSSDHFYYMANKCASDGEVHGYFSPFVQPVEAYLEYRNALSNFENLLQTVKE